jgi:hypothetical protein
MSSNRNASAAILRHFTSLGMDTLPLAGLNVKYMILGGEANKEGHPIKAFS